MKIKQHPKRSKRNLGFLLMEVVIALGLFAAVAVGFTMALSTASRSSRSVAVNVQVTRILESSLLEALSTPVLEEGEKSVDLDELSMIVVTKNEKMEEMENKDGQLLQDMWRITVTVYYQVNNTNVDRSAITWRYGRLYQP